MLGHAQFVQSEVDRPECCKPTLDHQQTDRSRNDEPSLQYVAARQIYRATTIRSDEASAKKAEPS